MKRSVLWRKYLFFLFFASSFFPVPCLTFHFLLFPNPSYHPLLSSPSPFFSSLLSYFLSSRPRFFSFLPLLFSFLPLFFSFLIFTYPNPFLLQFTSLSHNLYIYPFVLNPPNFHSLLFSSFHSPFHEPHFYLF